ncbi:hypothetical protein SAMN05421852_1389 [Thermoflavimicrobium dichotomicum]|uniref:Uncharacterized protein n=1 Tax=Thermoflavimicrobium dichotomicum TaxID=46223 RepID=A0A1I3V9Q8_9BACL|nr:hypothetical protein SAMN05421852_1389 [Thermoflavimicrobium dichotomicum]
MLYRINEVMLHSSVFKEHFLSLAFFEQRHLLLYHI